ncbi:MAG TPA: hypothetical protein VKR55_13920 [Bradyrhizobium sp.]|uniref:hypothetical protein n=1 Tax=Bradyrhizobium sp. TaxID=376 RepID=UPI002C525AD9|nr:hypothetical protein [Bradyrhizobium sp.]HLZ03231.1 hypothetical protein [Bradyrhizobium sp.]
MRKMTAKEAIARIFPTYDRSMADRVLRWLDQCGYQIVEKDKVTLLPPDSAEDEHRRAPEFH